MRKYILLFLFVNSYYVAYNQVIKGVIIDRQTKSAISFAAVYFNGTYVGTTSDENGNFRLVITKHASKPLTISAVGYYSYTLSDFSAGEPIIISLKPKVYEIMEVSVSAKSLSRERKANLKFFRNAFLGTTQNARNCEIINENDITFNYGFDTDTLKAIALMPILIHNKALGYNITYYLDKFEYDKESKIIFFTGNILFSEDVTTYKRFSDRRRKYAYNGSRMQFFRALWAGDLKSENFTIENSMYENLKIENVVVQEDNDRKYLKYYEDLHIFHFKTWSKLNFLKEQVFFDKDEFFDPSGINWEGELARKRIGDWLPYEYSTGY